MTDSERPRPTDLYRVAAPTSDALSSLPQSIAAHVRDEVSPHEQIVWASQPIAARAALRETATSLFAIFWMAFVVYWISMASRASLLFAMWGVPFACVGVWMLTSPLRAYLRARGSAYVLTDRRAIHLVASIGGRLTSRSYEPAEITALQRIERADGTGDVILRERVVAGSRSSRVENLGFFDVHDCRAVEQRVRALRARRSRESDASDDALSVESARDAARNFGVHD
jgi:hypothetical protein